MWRQLQLKRLGEIFNVARHYDDTFGRLIILEGVRRGDKAMLSVAVNATRGFQLNYSGIFEAKIE